MKDENVFLPDPENTHPQVGLGLATVDEPRGVAVKTRVDARSLRHLETVQHTLRVKVLPEYLQCQAVHHLSAVPHHERVCSDELPCEQA